MVPGIIGHRDGASHLTWQPSVTSMQSDWSELCATNWCLGLALDRSSNGNIDMSGLRVATSLCNHA